MPNFHEFLCQKRQLINEQVNLERSFSSAPLPGAGLLLQVRPTKTYCRIGHYFFRPLRTYCENLTLSIYFRERAILEIVAKADLKPSDSLPPPPSYDPPSLLTAKFAMALFCWWGARLS